MSHISYLKLDMMDLKFINQEKLRLKIKDDIQYCYSACIMTMNIVAVIEVLFKVKQKKLSLSDENTI